MAWRHAPNGRALPVSDTEGRPATMSPDCGANSGRISPSQVPYSRIVHPPDRYHGRFTSYSADDYLKVHHRGLSDADVTEGSGGVWERLHYDWSDPNRVVMTTTDSNLWGGHSGHVYTFTRRPDGKTDVDATA